MKPIAQPNAPWWPLWLASPGRARSRASYAQMCDGLLAGAIEGYATNDADRVHDCILLTLEICENTESAGIYTPAEARALRHDWLASFINEATAALTWEERRAFIHDPESIARFLPPRQRLAMLRPAYRDGGSGGGRAA